MNESEKIRKGKSLYPIDYSSSMISDRMRSWHDMSESSPRWKFQYQSPDTVDLANAYANIPNHKHREYINNSNKIAIQRVNDRVLIQQYTDRMTKCSTTDEQYPFSNELHRPFVKDFLRYEKK